jgi:hypothetical protein
MLALLAQSSTGTATSAGLSAGIVLLIIGGGIVWLAFVVLMIASLWKLFEKAGQKGWTSIVPILNTVVVLKVTHKELWWLVVAIIPCTAWIAFIVIYFNLAKAFGKGAGWGVGTIILPFIFVPALAFGSAQYVLQPDPLFT